MKLNLIFNEATGFPTKHGLSSLQDGTPAPWPISVDWRDGMDEDCYMPQTYNTDSNHGSEENIRNIMLFLLADI